jgi:hypothetical protein
MHTGSIERFGALMRWAHVPLFVVVAGIVGFVSLHFGTGRWWLGSAAVGVRLVSLVANFIFAPNLSYREISALKQIAFLGDRVWVVAQSVPSHRTRIVELSSLLVLIFVVDASVALWRKGGREARRRAAVVGGSTTLFVVIARRRVADPHRSPAHPVSPQLSVSRNRRGDGLRAEPRCDQGGADGG